MVLAVRAGAFLALNGRMMVGISDWIGEVITVYDAGEAFSGLGKAGLITIIVISLIAIVTFVWIFRETGRRD
jgi:hypothetical protein